MFYSNREKLPWLQWKLPNETTVIGIAISDEYNISPFKNDTAKEDLLNFEVRAGMTSLAPNFRGEINVNSLCGKVEKRGGEDRVYVVQCKEPIQARYVTVQLIDDNTILHINELEIIKASEGMIIGSIPIPI